MLVKQKEPRDRDRQQLVALLCQNLTARQKFFIERQLHLIESGERGEADSAAFLDFYYQDSPDWAIIHDLRIENNGFSAEIDHILINRFFEIYVLESKNFSDNLKITVDGEFLVFDGHRYLSVGPRVEENKKHARLVKRILQENDMFPRKLGFPIHPRFQNYILVSPQSTVLRPPVSVLDTSMVVPADSFAKTLLQHAARATRSLKNLLRLPRIPRADSFIKAACWLAELHTAPQTDYSEKFGIKIDHSRPLCENSGSEDGTAACDYAI